MTQRVAVKLTVRATEPPSRFCFRWAYPDGEHPHDKGWDTHLASLRNYVARQS
jgi:uncharacterized protein YndB with AHSA1/START domain